jgi:putative ABC transport system substrate-binding protein
MPGVRRFDVQRTSPAGIEMIVSKQVLLLLAAVTISAAPLPAKADQAAKIYRVGFILTTTPVREMAGPDPVHLPFRAFVHALRDLGYVEGSNLILERRSAEGRFERLGDIAAELVNLKTDVLVVINSLVVQRAHQVTGSDLVAIGLAQSLARPGGNVTGLTAGPTLEIDAKRLELLKEVAPAATRIAFLGMNSDWESPLGQSVRRAAHALGVTLVLAEHQPNDYTSAFALIKRQRANAIYLASNPPNWQHRRLIAGFATNNRLPSTYTVRDYTEAGGLMSYGFDVVDNCRRAAQYVDKILKGAKPADLPIEEPAKFELVINIKTARAIGLRIPRELLLRANQLVE